VLATNAAVGVVARNSRISQVFANRVDRLTIHLAKTLNTVARASGQATEKLAELERHMI
jgi:hypothetical protein